MYKLYWEIPSPKNLTPAGIDNILNPKGVYQSHTKGDMLTEEALSIYFAITNTQYMKEVMGEFSPYEVIFHPQIYQEDFKGTHYYFYSAQMKNYFKIKNADFENDVIWNYKSKEVLSIKKICQVMSNKKFIDSSLKRMRIGRGILEIDFWNCLLECNLLSKRWSISYDEMLAKTKDARLKYWQSYYDNEKSKYVNLNERKLSSIIDSKMHEILLHETEDFYNYLKQTSKVIKSDGSSISELIKYLRENYSLYEEYLNQKKPEINGIHVRLDGEKTKQIIEEENQRESKLDPFLTFLDSWYDRDGNTVNSKKLPLLIPLSKKFQYIIENFLPASMLKEFIEKYKK